MSKKKILITISIFLILLTGILHHLRFIYILPISEYHKKTKPIDIQATCEEIKNSQSKNLCLTVVKSNNFEKSLALVVEARGYPPKALENFPWYSYDYLSSDSPSLRGVKKILTENIKGENLDSASWCKEFSVLSDGTLVKEDYNLCRSFLENPYFCEKAPSNDKLKNKCYGDAALVWQDPSLCAKALDQDSCYLYVVLNYLKSQIN